MLNFDVINSTGDNPTILSNIEFERDFRGMIAERFYVSHLIRVTLRHGGREG